MNKEKRALNIFISNELYNSLKEFAFNNDDSMARTVSKALKQYINIDIQRPTIEYNTVKKEIIQQPIKEIYIDKWTPAWDRAAEVIISKKDDIITIEKINSTQEYSKEAILFYETNKDILSADQEDYVKETVTLLTEDSIKFINKQFRDDIDQLMKMNNLKSYIWDFEEWIDWYKEDIKYITI